MNLRTCVKTLAVAAPLSVAPMKTTAQTVAKEAKAVRTEAVRYFNRGSNLITQKAEPLYVKGNIGAGYGVTPFMHQNVSEPKVYGSLGLTNESLTASVNAAVGKNSQTYGVKIGGNIKTGNPNLKMETGILFDQHNFQESKDLASVVLKGDVEATKGKCVETHLGTAFFGGYFKPSYQIGKTNIHANLEAGMAGVAGNITGTRTASGAALKEKIAKSLMVDRRSTAAAARVGVGADVEVAKNLKVGGDYTYSTYDKNSGFNVKATYNFRTKDFRNRTQHK